MSKPRADESSVLFEVLDRYLADLETGQAPDREQLLARHPELRERLEACLDSLDFIRRTGGVPAADLPEGDVDGTIGDYRIRREVGRGGMGVVYEAEQISLQRRVALKVLPLAGVLDPKHLQRFRNEAQAAAHLHHSHIVPVYSVGCERGVHHYAMQYIEGISVAEMIVLLRDGCTSDDPSSSSAVSAITGGRGPHSVEYCRAVARLGCHAAEALDHAHERGVVHRDVKPGNLLVDTGGHVWITDFGLASFSTNPGLTMTGDLVGTVRYMSPEQALGRRATVDYRTDIYSLGLTLVECLTLKTTFPGDDVHQVIQDIALRSPPSPRQRNPSVPPELETILRKATANSPSDRYDTALEMAEDLQRFLEHKPILARKPSLAKRAGQWAYRHKPVVWAAAGVLLVAFVALIASNVLIQRKSELLAAEHARAERHLARLFDVVDRTMTRLSGDLLNEPHLEELRRELLDDVLAVHLAVLEDEGGSERTASLAGDAWINVGHIRTMLGEHRGAIEAFEAGLACLPEFDDLPNGRRRATALQGAARAYGVVEEPERERELLEQALSIRQELARRGEASEEDLFGLAAILQALGAHHSLRTDLDKADRFHAREREIRERLVAVRPKDPRHRDGLAGTLSLQAHVALKRGALADCAELIGEAIEQEQAALAEVPGHRTYRWKLVTHQRILGRCRGAQMRAEEARAALTDAIATASRLVGDFPRTPHYVHELALCELELAQALGGASEFQECTKHALAARERLAELVDAHADVPEYRAELASAHNMLGNAYVALNRPAEAAPVLREAIRLSEELYREFGGSVYLDTLVRALLGTASLSYRTNPRDAVAAYRKAGEYDNVLLREREDGTLRGRLASTHYNLANVLTYLQEFDEAKRSHEQCREILDRLVRESGAARPYRLLWACATAELGGLENAASRCGEAESLLREAIRTLEEARAENGTDVQCRDALGRTQVKLAQSLAGQGKDEEAEAALREALGHHRELGRVPTPYFREALAVTLTELGGVLVRTGKPEEADALLAESLGILDQLAKAAPGIPYYRGAVALVRHYQAQLCQRRGERAVAIQLAREAVEGRPDNPAHRVLLGQLLGAEKKWDEAAACLEEAVRRGAKGDGIFLLAIARWHAGAKPGARAAFAAGQLWLAEHPGHLEAKRIRAEASLLLGLSATGDEGDEEH